MSLSLDDLSLPGLVRQAANRFIGQLEQHQGLAPLPPPEQPPHPSEMSWQNTLFSGPAARRAHVEVFELREHFAVLHVCIFPDVNDPAPIFGFDMIGGRTQATGLFLDFSPVLPEPPRPSLQQAVPCGVLQAFTHKRERPDWGEIFSPDFFAIRPVSRSEIEAAIGLAETALAFYLRHLGARVADKRIAEGQAAYVCGQRRNPHTFRMLARYVGEPAARRFIERVLFPWPADD